VHKWEHGHAITAMEIYHGFLRKPYTPVHAFMYKRDPSFIPSIKNPDHRRIFDFDYASQPEIRERRDKLMYVRTVRGRRPRWLCGREGCGVVPVPLPLPLTHTPPSPPPPPPRGVHHAQSTANVFRLHDHGRRCAFVWCCVRMCSGDIMDHQFCKNREYSCTYGGLDEEGKPHVTNLQVR
jgi:hypothetical protein